MHPNKVGVPAAKGQTQGTMDSHRTVETYKLFRNESSLSGTTVLLHWEVIGISTNSHGQCHSDYIPEQDGRQPFPLLIRSGQGSVDVVH